MELNLFIQKLFEGAGAARYEASEAAYQREESFEVSVKDGEIIDYSVATTIAFTFRALVNGRMGYATTQVFDEDALDLLLTSVKDNAGMIENADERFIFEGSKEYASLDVYNPAIDAIPAAEKIAMARALEEKTKAIDPRARDVERASVFTSSAEKRIVNSKGLDVSFRENAIGLGVAVLARDGGQVAVGSKYLVKRDPAAISLEETAGDAVKEAVDGLSAQPIPSGEYRVVMPPDIMRSMLGCFSPIFSAEAAQKGMSLLAGKEGVVIASPCVTLVDDPLNPDGLAATPFDGEGVATQKRSVVTAGRFDTLLHNLKTAQKQGVATTANASWGGTGVAPTNFYLAPGSISKEELYAQAGEALFITEVNGLHAGANQISGDFSLGAKGYMIRGGKLCETVNQITVAGNFYEMLKDVEAVASDLEFGFPGGSCFGAPTTMIRALKVAGK